MKIAIIGAAGVRTPLLVHAIAMRQQKLGVTELALMDIDGAHLELIGRITQQLEMEGGLEFKLVRTTSVEIALQGADFVITTFRVGGIQSRVIDERVPLAHGILGQETTGPGGFAMAMRTLPALQDIIQWMKRCCPQAWLINFANPSGLLTQAVLDHFEWERAVGICDAPTALQRAAAGLLGVSDDQVFLNYFGLNHLGWARAVVVNGVDFLPELLDRLGVEFEFPELPLSTKLIKQLGLIPNEYLYYYYQKHTAVQSILRAPETRGEQILRLNTSLFVDLKAIAQGEDDMAMLRRYTRYLEERESSYMIAETGQKHHTTVIQPEMLGQIASGGYAGVALDAIEALAGGQNGSMILNTRNLGAIDGMRADDVVEVTAGLSQGMVRPFATGQVPEHCLGLMQQIKEFERLTIAAALEGSYTKALLALTIHPLVADEHLAGMILNEYMEKHGATFPALK